MNDLLCYCILYNSCYYTNNSKLNINDYFNILPTEEKLKYTHKY